jgi:hypothetical protein
MVGKAKGRSLVETLGDIAIDDAVRRCREAPHRMETLFSICLDCALRSPTLAERKAWELLDALISIVTNEHRSPSETEFVNLRAKINSSHRKVPRSETTAAIEQWLEDFNTGERELKKYFNSVAWKGTPGFTPDGRSLSEIEFRKGLTTKHRGKRY